MSTKEWYFYHQQSDTETPFSLVTHCHWLQITEYHIIPIMNIGSYNTVGGSFIAIWSKPIMTQVSDTMSFS